MRFSSVFQLPLMHRGDAQPAQPAKKPQGPLRVAEAPPTDYGDLPEELDQRVRLVGEWQQLGAD